LKSKSAFYKEVGISIVFFFLMGCGSLVAKKDIVQIYTIPESEASWIRDGQPLLFEDEEWYPQDAVEILIDEEVILLGQYLGTQFFVEKRDVRLYNRLYTKFGKNKYRLFEKQVKENDFTFKRMKRRR